jgi:hypothetical protein
MRLTSSVKELEAILQKLIKFEPGLIQIDKNNEHLRWRRWRCGCPRTWGRRGWARCSGAKQTKRKLFSQELEQKERKPL